MLELAVDVSFSVGGAGEVVADAALARDYRREAHPGGATSVVVAGGPGEGDVVPEGVVRGIDIRVLLRGLLVAMSPIGVVVNVVGRLGGLYRGGLPIPILTIESLVLVGVFGLGRVLGILLLRFALHFISFWVFISDLFF